MKFHGGGVNIERVVNLYMKVWVIYKRFFIFPFYSILLLLLKDVVDFSIKKKSAFLHLLMSYEVIICLLACLYVFCTLFELTV